MRVIGRIGDLCHETLSVGRRVEVAWHQMLNGDAAPCGECRQFAHALDHSQLAQPLSHVVTHGSVNDHKGAVLIHTQSIFPPCRRMDMIQRRVDRCRLYSHHGGRIQ